MIFFQSTQDKVLAALQSVAGIVERRHTIPALADFLCTRRVSGTSITSGLMTGTICDGDADCSDATGADSAPAAASDDDDGGDADPEPARQPPHPTPAIAPHSAATQRRKASTTAGNPLDPVAELWPLKRVLAHVPVCRTLWYAGVKSGIYPKPVKLGQRRVAWRAEDIRAFIQSL